MVNACSLLTMEEAAAKILIRPFTTDDLSFILSSWIQSYKDSSEFAKHIHHEIYFKYHRKIVEGILSRKSTTTLIATITDEPTLIYGYSVFEKLPSENIVHYVYVKRAFNKFGLCKLLLEAAPFSMEGASCSHLTGKGLKLARKLKLAYNPYLI